MRRIATVVFAVLLLAALLLGCGETAAPKKVGEAGSGEATTESSSSESKTYKVGDMVEIGDMVVTLNRVRKLSNTDFDKPQDSKNKFVAVDLTFKNTGSEAANVSSLLQISLVDGAGYSAQQTIHTKAKPLKEGEVGAGRKMSGEIVYEVAKDAKDLQVIYDASLLGEGQIIWNVGSASKIK